MAASHSGSGRFLRRHKITQERLSSVRVSIVGTEFKQRIRIQSFASRILIGLMKTRRHISVLPAGVTGRNFFSLA